MPRVSNKQVVTDRQDPKQPALFDDDQMPMESGALESIRAKRYEHQGVRLVEDDAKALRLVDLLTLKWGAKKISREMHISTHTVRAARRLLVTQGKLAPYKQRVVEAMEDAIEAGVENYREALEKGIVPAAQIPVGVAIMFDKRALAMGEPTSISNSTGSADQLKVEDLNRYLDQLPSCKPADSESTANVAKPQQKEGNPPADATLDTTDGRPGPDGRTPG